MAAAQPFMDAILRLLSLEAMPTRLSSEQLQQIDAAVRRNSLFSARTIMETYLEEIRSTVESVINPQQVARPGMPYTVTEGFNRADAVLNLSNALDDLGYEPGGARGIQNLKSEARLRLIVKTQTEMARNSATFIEENSDPEQVDAWPAWEFTRQAVSLEPRDWPSRWMAAAASSGDYAAADALARHGKMAALKSSRIWQDLGNGAGGYDDTLGNPYPPFAFNSNMGTFELNRKAAIDLGLMVKGGRGTPNPLSLDSLLKVAA